MKRPKITVDAVIVKNNSVLLIKRRFHPHKEKWALPGGYVEYNETAEEAVIREVKEETGLNVRIKRLAGVYSDPKRDPRGHTITIVFECIPSGNVNRKTRETKNAAFFPLKEIKRMKLAFDHKKIIRDVLGFKTVLAGGRFNILHPGHIYFLEKAKSLGDRLVVVIANDSTVRKNRKGLLFSHHVRKKMVESVKCVDDVVIGNPGDIMKTVERIRPDIICLGYDDPLKEKDLKKGLKKMKIKCRVVRIGRLKGYNTSLIIDENKINKKNN